MNSDTRKLLEAVQQGAKPLEVEGLAKPMAARLMSLARPGQILLSPVAEPLVHRASRELGLSPQRTHALVAKTARSLGLAQPRKKRADAGEGKASHAPS